MLYLISKVYIKKGKPVLILRDFGSKRSITAYGFSPLAFSGMRMNLTLISKGKGMEITDFSVPLDDSASGKANKTILSKSGQNISEYKETCETLKSLKESCEKGGVDPSILSWDMAKDKNKLYELLDFSVADKYFKALGGNERSRVRLSALIREVLLYQRQHRRAISYDYEDYISAFEAVEKKSAFGRLEISAKMALLNDDAFILKDNRIIDAEMQMKEDFIRRDIMERKHNLFPMLDREDIIDFRNSLSANLADEQLYTLNSLMDSSPSVITGGAGVGKTTVIKTIIDCYGSFYNTDDILLIAPTGKAGRRLREKTGYNASTIHKALRKAVTDDFLYFNKANKLPHKLIVVDESSMVDTELMYDLLNAARAEAKLIFVGDSNQLKPVQYGEPFFDFQKMIDTYTLSENHRQEGDTDILRAAEQALDYEEITSGNGVVVENITEDDIADILTRLENNNTQFISPTKAFCEKVNNAMMRGDEPFTVGDKVIFNKNHEEWCNGDMGIITSTDDENIYVNTDGRTVAVPRKLLRFPKEISLGYCITVHKMQGSECDRVVAFLRADSNFDKESSMLYTAITRAKKELYIYYY